MRRLAPVLDGWVQIVRCPRAQVRHVAQSWPTSGASRKLQEQSVSQPLGGLSKQQQKSVWDVPLLTISKSPSQQSFRGSHRRGATSGSSSVRVGRRKSSCDAVGGGPSSCPCHGQSPSFGGANHCVQEFRRTSKEKGDSGGGRHLQSPRTEGGVRDGSAGRRSAIAAIGGLAFPPHRGCSRVSHRCEGGHRESAPRSVEWQMVRQLWSQFLQSPCLLRKISKDGRATGVARSGMHWSLWIRPQSHGLWWHRGQLNWQVLYKECMPCRRWSSPILFDDSVDRRSRRQTPMRGGGAFNVGEPSVRNARYGLSGVRVGERRRTQVHHKPGFVHVSSKVAEDILASLEHDLTLIDSDDEPLVRGGSDRNVVPRLEASVTGVCRESCRLALSEGATSAIAGRVRLSQPAPTGVWTRRRLSGEAVAVLQLGSKVWVNRVDCARFRCHTACGSRSADVAHETVCWMHSNMIWCATV